MLRRAQRIAFIIGIAFFAGLIYSVGPGAILRDLLAIGWGLAIVVLLELCVDAMNTLGWRFTFPRRDRKVGFVSLYLVRMAGTAFNQVLPSASVGGEPLKAVLLSDALPLSRALASVVSAKFTFSLAQGLFAFAGLLLAFRQFRFPPVVLAAFVGSSLAVLGFLSIFYGLQRRGLFATAARTLERLHLPERWVERMRRGTGMLDAHIRDFLAGRPADFALSLASHLGGLLIGAAQVYILLRWLDLNVGVRTCVIIEAVAILIQVAAFLVPGSIGIQEGGKVVIFAMLGLPMEAGLSVGIAFRLSQIVGIALGLAAFAFLHWRKPLLSREPVPHGSVQRAAGRPSAPLPSDKSP